ncbi:hypothetical protein CLHOM_00860 [Clostridium homopropionicum DSM 5847]|uniref:Uncharacterized protein n=1 Tax=Clostridium homopropionicum DSM 5847 TaxID=1121318 RepID=A0A0L6ZEL1_9CLOT|nr:prepilin-type N-terminal cleavage/methylation domain-containing protein [Clostridium homopropionicum]KOA21415.1 hypothetical protein CLHOM_00860 [Clostridium homopropionicum DSM 5847]SFG10603.1 prepilin-type N-terminal cleavage/methylation domain-containing protein [Clostridium homopropionicum]
MEKFFRVYSKKAKRGFTLLEIIIAIGILSIILVPFSNLVLNSFKVAHEAKTKQEAVNIAQKYMEKIKSDNSIELDKIIDNGASFSQYGYPSSENDFSISYTVERDGNFLIPPPTSGTDTNVYDYRFEISDEGDWVKVYDKTVIVNSEQKIVPNFQIANNADNIIYKINDEENTISKTKVENEDIIIRVDINRNFSDGLPEGAPSKQPDNTLTVTAENKCSGQLIFYFVKSATLQQDVKCQIINLGGSIKRYDNIIKVNSSTGYGALSRIYKITIEVEKNGQKIINESYKTFY